MDLTECRRFFERPATPSQRQYEALRAYFIEGLASAEAARRFGYTPAAFRMLCYDFRRGQLADFFTVKRTGPQQQPKKGKLHDIVVALRKRNYSIYDISHALKEQGTPLGTTAVREILAAEGFAPLPRRLDEERPVGVAPTTEAVADVRSFALRTGEFTTCRWRLVPALSWRQAGPGCINRDVALRNLSGIWLSYRLHCRGTGQACHGTPRLLGVSC